MQGYEKLDDVLARAFKQASEGKGAERHANDLPFHEQPMQQIANQVGRGFILGQAIKKVVESQNLPPERAVNELLGAINYIAGAVIHLEAKNLPADYAVAEMLGVINYNETPMQSVSGEWLNPHKDRGYELGYFPVCEESIKVPKGAVIALESYVHRGFQFAKDIYDGYATFYDYHRGCWEGSRTIIAGRKTIWQRELCPDQAREVLAKMKRGDSVKINGFNIDFGKHGAFDVRREGDFGGHFSQSLKATLNYIFQDSK